MTDARHGWRKDARHSDVVAIGFHTINVIGLEVVTKDDNPVSQRRETLGIKKKYMPILINVESMLTITDITEMLP